MESGYIPFSGDIKTAFESQNGLNATAGTIYDNLGYDPGQLDPMIKKLNSNSNIKLIVSIGGLTPALRVARVATTDFIAIVGSTANPILRGSGHFKGALDLQCVKTNADRVTHIRGNFHPKIALEAVCLVLNRNSEMAIEEQLDAVEGLSLPPGNIVLIDIDENTTDQGATTAFTNAFNTITTGGWEAVIISADPFITKFAGKLVTQANTWATSGQWMSYPLNEYSKQTDSHSHTFHGPKLNDGYVTLGNMAVSSSNYKIVQAPQIVDDHP